MRVLIFFELKKGTSYFIPKYPGMKKITLFFVFQFVMLLAFSQVTVTNLLCENLSNPVGLDIRQPSFSWQLASNKRNVMQKAYEINVFSRKKLIWKSGKIVSDQSVQIPFSGSELQSGNSYQWRVRVWENDNKPSAWSSSAHFQMALLNKSDWKAKWITPAFTEDSINRPAILFRKEFSAPKKILSATAYITSHGMYEAQINGKRVGDSYLSPGWTSYNKRLQYQVYDVTQLLNAGKNALAVTLGNGWYRGFLAWGDNKNIYGRDISLLFQLSIKYTDGSHEDVVSDGSWKSSTGSILFSEIYDGETIDARKEKSGWNKPGYDDKNWSGVAVENYSFDNLLATYNEPIKKHETFIPLKIFTTPKW
jgi:alpha-L-rhamnosidase